MQTMTDGTPQGNIILYQTEDGQSRIDVTLSGDTVWLTADQMAELFQRNKSTISRHIRNVFESGELNPDSTVAKNATVQNEGNRKVERNIAYYNLDVIISVGYRVNSHRGVQFRIWATQILGEYLVKGFAMNDDLLKRAGGGNYFDELLEGNVEPQEAYERACRQAPQGFIVPLETGPRKCFGQLPHYYRLDKIRFVRSD